MRKGIFDPENGLFETLALLVDIIGLSIAWVFCCVPVVTIGASTAALYHTVYKRFHCRKQETFRIFFKSLIRELKKGTVATLIFIVAAAVFAVLYYWYSLASDNLGSIGRLAYAFYFFAALIPTSIMLWVFPLLGRFEFSIKELFKTAFAMSVAHLPTTVLMLVITAAAVWSCLILYMLVFLVPSVWLLLMSLPMERAFKKHLPPEESDTDET